MKKLLFLLLIFFVLSCEKDTGCWECTVTIRTTCVDTQSGYASGGGTTDVIKTTTTVCDMTTREINALEKSWNTTTTATAGSIVCTSKSTGSCRRQ